MKRRKVIALIMTLMMVMSIFGGSTSAVFAEGDGGTQTSSAGYLSAFSMKASSSGSAAAYELEPAFSPDVHEYDVIVPDSSSSNYIFATLSDAAAGGKITAKWKNCNNESDRTSTITSGSSYGTYLAYLQAAGGISGRVLTLEVTNGSDTQQYKFTTKVDRTLSGLTATAGGSKLILDPAFNKDTKAYTVKTAKSNTSVTVKTTLRSNYKVEIDGKTADNGNAEVALGEDTSKAIPIKVSYKDTDNSSAGEYTLTVDRIDAVKATFNVVPADAIVQVKDSAGERVKAGADGTYECLPGAKYTYTVTKNGYVGQSGEFTIDENTVKDITLDKAAENSKINKNIKSEWKNFRNSDENMAITNARTPISASTTNLRWAKMYGTGWSAAPCIQLIVDGKVLTIVGSTLYQLNPDNGEIEKQCKLAAAINWGYTPMTYAEGMIFCPLANGTIQAVNADTFESLWVYQDPLKGQSLSPITYSDGYIYTGFWNSETKDANYVCLSVTDEDVEQTTESKLATWTFTNEGGFYWAGSVAVGDALIFGTDDGESGHNGASNLYSVNKYTGEIISELDITGDQRSTIAYDKTSGKVYGTTKAGYLFSASVDAKTGKLSDLKTENYNAQSTSTPVVYKGKVYFGTGSGISTTGSSGNLVVADADTLKMDYAVGLKGYPQSSVMLSTAYEESTGYIYLYSTYNAKPGGVSMIKTKPDNSKAEGAELVEIFDAKGYEEFCITSLICDEDGTIFYKNDSCNIFSLESNEAYLESMDITGGNPVLDSEFAAGTKEYEAVVDVDTESVSIKVKASAGSTIELNGEAMTSDTADIALTDGKAEAVFKVVNGKSERTYKVSIREKSQNASLGSLVVNESNAFGTPMTMDPVFDADKTYYTVYKAGSSRSFENLWPETADSNAEYKVYAVAGIDDKHIDVPETGEIKRTAKTGTHDRYAIYFGSGRTTTVVRVEVTAEDGKTVKNYYVTMTKESSLDDILPALNDMEGALPIVKYHANNKLDSQASAEDYDQAELDEINVIIKDAKRQIKSADNAEDVDTIVAKAIQDIGKIDTKADKAQAEKEKAEALVVSKRTAVAELQDSVPDMSEYRLAEQVSVLAALLKGQVNINDAADEDAVKAALEASKAEIAAIKTDADYRAEALAASEVTLTAKASNYSAAKLTWNAVEDAEKYEVYRSVSKNSGYKKLASTTKTSLTNIKLDTGTVYYYKVRAYANINDSDVYSQYSSVKSVKPVLGKVNSLSLKAGKSKAAISWKKVSGADGYKVYRSTSKSGSYKCIKTVTKGSTVKYINKNLKKGKTYYYKVKAYRTVNGKNVYGQYSTVKKVKITSK